MPGRIQSLERGAAVLALLGGVHGDLSLAEIASALNLPRPTVHGLLATLVHVGFVRQDAGSRRYELGSRLGDLQQQAVDRHDLRSRATSWCDSLAQRTHAEVLVCIPVPGAAEVVHHVFRPDNSPQRLRVGEQVPLHATGVGKVLLASSVSGSRGAGELTRFTRRTATTTLRLAAEIDRIRTSGFGVGYAEHAPDHGDVAAPVRGIGALAVGVIACTGPTDQLFTPDGEPRAAIRDEVVATAAAVTRALANPR